MFRELDAIGTIITHEAVPFWGKQFSDTGRAISPLTEIGGHSTFFLKCLELTALPGPAMPAAPVCEIARAESIANMGP